MLGPSNILRHNNDSVEIDATFTANPQQLATDTALECQLFVNPFVS